ncbi:MAG: hypothetical protein IH820_15515 [Bacteroidetes bacterium]|nr:hypothetical protein [Bacteroidota bacterium]
MKPVVTLFARRVLPGLVLLMGLGCGSTNRLHEVDFEDADFILDLHIANYGLVADSWEATVHFEVDAEMLLVDRRTRRVIWKKHLREVEPVSHADIGLGATFGNVFTAAALSTLSVEEMVVALGHLADFTAARLTATLRHDYYVSRYVWMFL